MHLQCQTTFLRNKSYTRLAGSSMSISHFQVFIGLAQTHHAAWTSVGSLRRLEFPLCMRQFSVLMHSCSLGVYGTIFVAGMASTLFGMSELVHVRTQCL